MFKRCSGNKGLRAGCSGQEGDGGEYRSWSWHLRVVPANFISQVTYEGIRDIRQSSQKPRNCGFAEDVLSKAIEQGEKGKKEILHKARPTLMLSALHLHIYT